LTLGYHLTIFGNYIYRINYEKKALLIGISSADALIGMVIGSIKAKIPIYGNIKKFNNNKSRLRKYSVK